VFRVRKIPIRLGRQGICRRFGLLRHLQLYIYIYIYIYTRIVLEYVAYVAIIVTYVILGSRAKAGARRGGA
jgi:hypothetical protein